MEDWTSTASTHLNICAIYSYLKEHQKAADHAELAIAMLEKVEHPLKDSQVDSEKSYSNIKMLSNYHLAIELEHLRRYTESKTYYSKAKQIAEENQPKNSNLIDSIK